MPPGLAAIPEGSSFPYNGKMGSSVISCIARDALAILDERGWTQFSCADEHGICLGTALCRAAGLPEDGKLTPGQLTTWMALTDAVLSAQRVVFPDAPFDATNAVPKLNDFSPAEDVRKILEMMQG